MMIGKSHLLTTGQAARLCSVTPDTILKWIKKGRLRGERTAGGHYRIHRRDIEPLIASARPTARPPSQTRESCPQGLRCWEYLADCGEVRDACRQCVVYRVRATHCFLMAGLETDIGHARRFCRGSCADCVYYRRAKGLATRVLVITSDDVLVDRLVGEQDENITLRFAKNAYEASAIIHDFRPAFAVIDVESVPNGGTELLDSIAADPRVPGLKITIVVPAGMADDKRRWPKNDRIATVLEEPLESRQIAAVIDNFPVDFLTPEDVNL